MSRLKVFAIIVSSVVVIGLIACGVLWYLDYLKWQSVTDFDSCSKASGIILETYPRQCRAKNGTLYTEKLAYYEYTSLKGVTVRLDDLNFDNISSPITITGKIPGSWSFEASFPVILTDWDGVIIAEKPASLQGDWMTEDYVPFTVTLDFESPSTYKNGFLILRKDNPSGLSENDDAIEIPITYK